MPGTGLEPALVAQPDPKSPLSSSSTCLKIPGLSVPCGSEPDPMFVGSAFIGMNRNSSCHVCHALPRVHECGCESDPRRAFAHPILRLLLDAQPALQFRALTWHRVHEHKQSAQHQSGTLADRESTLDGSGRGTFPEVQRATCRQPATCRASVHQASPPYSLRPGGAEALDAAWLKARTLASVETRVWEMHKVCFSQKF